MGQYLNRTLKEGGGIYKKYYYLAFQEQRTGIKPSFSDETLKPWLIDSACFFAQKTLFLEIIFAILSSSFGLLETRGPKKKPFSGFNFDLTRRAHDLADLDVGWFFKRYKWINGVA